MGLRGARAAPRDGLGAAARAHRAAFGRARAGDALRGAAGRARAVRQRGAAPADRALRLAEQAQQGGAPVPRAAAAPAARVRRLPDVQPGPAGPRAVLNLVTANPV